MELYNDQDPVNLGAGLVITICDLVQVIVPATEYEGDIRWDTSKLNGQPRRCLNTSRAKERFRFEATTSFETGLKTTVEWYQTSR